MRELQTSVLVNLTFAEVGNNLDLSNGSLDSLDCSGTRVRGELRLGSEMPSATKRRDKAHLILRNTEVGALQDLPEAWKTVDLEASPTPT